MLSSPTVYNNIKQQHVNHRHIVIATDRMLLHCATMYPVVLVHLCDGTLRLIYETRATASAKMSDEQQNTRQVKQMKRTRYTRNMLLLANMLASLHKQVAYKTYSFSLLIFSRV